MSSYTIPDNIFRQYDIRGVFGEELSVDIAEALGRAFVAFMIKIAGKKKATLAIGRDVRLSSTEIRDALIKGITGAGMDVIDIGECPSPLLYFATHTLEVDGGIMITGSHNPPEYNGFKISVGKETIHGQDIQALMRIMQGEAKHIIPTGDSPGSVGFVDIIELYKKDIAGKFKELPASSSPVRIAIDSGNGTGGPVAPALLRSIGAEVVELYSEVDGSFPQPPPRSDGRGEPYRPY